MIRSYYDDNCQDYANSVTLQDNFASSGGALGSRSAMFISIPGGKSRYYPPFGEMTHNAN